MTTNNCAASMHLNVYLNWFILNIAVSLSCIHAFVVHSSAHSHQKWKLQPPLAEPIFTWPIWTNFGIGVKSCANRKMDGLLLPIFAHLASSREHLRVKMMKSLDHKFPSSDIQQWAGWLLRIRSNFAQQNTSQLTCCRRYVFYSFSHIHFSQVSRNGTSLRSLYVRQQTQVSEN